MDKDYFPPEKPHRKSIKELKEEAHHHEGIILYHGGLPDDIEIDGIDLNRLGDQQNKPDRTYGGFYLTDDSSREWADKYAEERSGNVHAFFIDSSARILEIPDGDIDRLSQQQRDEFAEKYDLIKGKDILNRVQYVLLDKSIIKDFAVEKLG